MSGKGGASLYSFGKRTVKYNKMFFFLNNPNKPTIEKENGNATKLGCNQTRDEKLDEK